MILSMEKLNRNAHLDASNDRNESMQNSRFFCSKTTHFSTFLSSTSTLVTASSLNTK